MDKSQLYFVIGIIMLDIEENPILHCAKQSKITLFGDERLEKRAIALLDSMMNNCSIVIRRVGVAFLNYSPQQRQG